MTIQKLVFVLLLIITLSARAGTTEIMVGDRAINIPWPAGFVELTPEMSPHYEILRANVHPRNVRHLTLIDSDAAEMILRGESAEYHRYIHVEGQEDISAISVSHDTFTELRDAYRDQLVELYSEIEEELPDFSEKHSEALGEVLTAEVVVEIGGLVPLPIHLETGSTIANSMLMTVGTTVNREDLGAEVIAGTTLILHVKDKVLFLYVYGSESDLEWTRETAAQFAKEIVAANPLSASEKEALERSSSTGIDLRRVLDDALLGALIGGALGLAFFFFRNRGSKS